MLELPANNEPNTRTEDQPGTIELAGIVAALVDADTPQCDRALYALAKATHPWHSLVAERVADRLAEGLALFVLSAA